MDAGVRTVLLVGSRLAMSLDLAVNGAFPASVTFTRASTATFVGSDGLIQTASSGVARFGYDPSTMTALGYLCEEARTNLSLYSGTLSDASWVVTNASKTTGQTDPTGGTEAALITSDGTSGAHYVVASGSVVNTTQYAISIFVKPSGGTTRIQLATGYTAFSTNVYANYSLTGSGSVLASGAGVSNAAVQAFLDGWFRLSFIATASGTGAGPVQIDFITGDSDTRSPTNSSTDAVYVWGGQIEATSAAWPAPTSYIPTAGSTATRAADVASMTGTNFSSWYNQAAGTFITQATPGGDYNSRGRVLAARLDNNNNHQIYRSDAAGSAIGKRWVSITVAAASPVATLNTSANDTGATAKVALAYATNDFALAVDGAVVETDAGGALPSPTALQIGTYDGASFWFNGHIASIKYYAKRLPNNKLQSLTT